MLSRNKREGWYTGKIRHYGAKPGVSHMRTKEIPNNWHVLFVSLRRRKRFLDAFLEGL